MCMIKTPIVMKQNPLILAEFEKAFSEVDHDLLNALLHIMQNEHRLDGQKVTLFNYEKITERKVIIPASRLKELGKFGVNANQKIYESLKKIRDTSATIRNFTDINGKKVKAATVSIIDQVLWLEEGALGDGREQGFEIQYNEWFMQVSTRQFNAKVGNYTNIEIQTVSSLKSKHAKKLYEILNRQKNTNPEFSMSYDRAKVLFNMEESVFSYITQTIKRIAPKVNILIAFEFEVHKKDKINTFKILDVKK